MIRATRRALAAAFLCAVVAGPAVAQPSGRTLILYDVGGPWGRWGEIYATFAANLAGHFGGYDAEPVGAYRAGQIEAHSATIYLGSTFDEPLPPAFVAEARATRRPILWIGYGVEALVEGPGGLARFGWEAHGEDVENPVIGVDYKGERFTRRAAGAGGLMRTEIVTPQARVLASAVRADGRRAPWAIQADNLIYVAENPFPFMSESDRYLVFADLLFDLLAPQTPVRHRALVRLEDVGPTSDPAKLRAVADYLSSQGVPFSIAIYDSYRDPLRKKDFGRRHELAQSPAVIAAVRYMMARGGTLVSHGHTHQHGTEANPLSGLSAEDYEFFRVRMTPDRELDYLGPVQEDSFAWAKGRMEAGLQGLAAAGLPRPEIFEFPHYAASAVDYAASRALFGIRYERSMYFAGTLSGRPVDATVWAGQLFPYPVRDVYGQVVVPETLGNHEPASIHGRPPRTPKDILADARRNLVLRDTVASFYHHPYLDLDYLKQTVEGLKAQGYEFVSVKTLLADW